MDEEEGYMIGEEEEEEDDIGSSDFEGHFEMEDEEGSSHRDQQDDDFHYEVLTPDDNVQLMVDTIREVNAVVEVSD